MWLFDCKKVKTFINFTKSFRFTDCVDLAIIFSIDYGKYDIY
jgi:hypothetical protein